MATFSERCHSPLVPLNIVANSTNSEDDWGRTTTDVSCVFGNSSAPKQPAKAATIAQIEIRNLAPQIIRICCSSEAIKESSLTKSTIAASGFGNQRWQELGIKRTAVMAFLYGRGIW
jgi:hypothetical protein